MNRRAFARPPALALALALAACGGPPGGPAKPQELRFSILSAEDQAGFGPLWKPLLDDLSKAAGVKVTPFFSSNYTALVQAMKFDQTQVGWFSAEPALEAVDRAGAQVFARTVDLDGRDTYDSVVIVRKGSGLTLERILRCDRSLAFGMGDVKSTSGTLAPMTFLFAPRHLTPAACFRTVRDATHEANLFSVANGLLDASTNNSVGLDFARVGAPSARAAYGKLQVVWTSPPLPESALVYRKALDPALKARIAGFFTHYGQASGAEGERERAILARLHYTAFHPANDAYLQPVREMRDAAASAPSSRPG